MPRVRSAGCAPGTVRLAAAGQETVFASGLCFGIATGLTTLPVRLRRCPALEIGNTPHDHPLGDADGTEIFIGVDTHKDCHVAVALSAIGAVLDSRTLGVADAGVPLHVLRKIAGHGSLTTTQRYLHPDRRSIDLAGAALSAHLSGARIDPVTGPKGERGPKVVPEDRARRHLRVVR